MGALMCAFVAQSVERFLGKEEVAGPIPAEGLSSVFFRFVMVF